MRPPSLAANSAAPPQPVLTATAAGVIEHTDSGTGRTLMTLHGGMGGFDQSWLLARAMLPGLSGLRILALSRPGYLRTPQTVGATPDRQADAYAALLDALGIERTVVAAISAGGPSAIAFAIRHPDRCERLILISAATGPLETAPIYIRRLRQLRLLSAVPGLAGWMARRRLSDPDGALRRGIPGDAERQRTLEHPAAGPLVLAVLATSFSNLPRRIPGTLTDTVYFQTMASPDYSRIAAPILVIHGDADPTVPAEHAHRILRAAPTSDRLVIPGAGHLALFTHLDDVRDAVASFLAVSSPAAHGPS